MATSRPLPDTKCVIEGAFEDLDDAFSRFFKGQNAYPTFKKKNKSRESFSIANDKFSLGDHWIVVPVARSVSSQQAASERDPPPEDPEQAQVQAELGQGQHG